MPPRSKPPHPPRFRQSTMNLFFQSRLPHSPPPNPPTPPNSSPPTSFHPSINEEPDQPIIGSPAPPLNLTVSFLPSLDLPPRPVSLKIVSPFTSIAIPPAQASKPDLESPVTPSNPAKPYLAQPPIPCVALQQPPSRLSRSRTRALRAAQKSSYPSVSENPGDARRDSLSDSPKDNNHDDACTRMKDVNDVPADSLPAPTKRRVGRPRKRPPSPNQANLIDSNFEFNNSPKDLADGDRLKGNKTKYEASVNKEQVKSTARRRPGRPKKKEITAAGHGDVGQKSSLTDGNGKEAVPREDTVVHRGPLTKDGKSDTKKGINERQNEAAVLVTPRIPRRTGRARRRGAALVEGKREIPQLFYPNADEADCDSILDSKEGRDEHSSTCKYNEKMARTTIEMAEDLEEEAEEIEDEVEMRRGAKMKDRSPSPKVGGKHLHPFFQVNSRSGAKGQRGPGEGDADKLEEVEDWSEDNKSEEEGEEEIVAMLPQKRKTSDQAVKKELHPFFRETAAAVMKEKVRVKRHRVYRPLVDAWVYGGATIHVNHNQALGTWEGAPPLGKDVKISDKAIIELGLKLGRNSSLYDSAQRKEIVTFAGVSPDLWAEKFKLNKRIDVISASATTELVDWLRQWYAENEGFGNPQSQSHTDSDSSLEGLEEIDKETLAIITGPVGCGKSTVVANAARTLGLSVLEINASSCRTGKRVRDVVREALRTHRVASRKPNSHLEGLVVKKKSGSRSSDGFETANARTLILFEEVDELHDDEKGFWGCIQELVESRECRRPIICTANRFSHLMRQWFEERNGPVQADVNRLLINTKLEQIQTPVVYKHITLPTRTEKQALAVLNEVASAEGIEVSRDAISCLAVTSPGDLRRAVNALHFWGLQGLLNVDVVAKDAIQNSVSSSHNDIWSLPSHPDVSILRGLTETDFPENVFHIATRKIIDGNCLRLERDEANLDHNFAKWISSLEILTLSDNISHATSTEEQQRCLCLAEDGLDLCMDIDLQHCLETGRGLSEEAVSYSLSHLEHAEFCSTIEELGRECMPMKSVLTLPDVCPRPRRPIMSEYLPVLRTMAVKQETSVRNDGGPKRSLAGLSTRRTRASMRRGGFHALDLTPSTVSALNRDYLIPEK